MATKKILSLPIHKGVCLLFLRVKEKLLFNALIHGLDSKGLSSKDATVCSDIDLGQTEDRAEWEES